MKKLLVLFVLASNICLAQNDDGVLKLMCECLKKRNYNKDLAPEASKKMMQQCADKAVSEALDIGYIEKDMEQSAYSLINRGLFYKCDLFQKVAKEKQKVDEAARSNEQTSSAGTDPKNYSLATHQQQFLSKEKFVFVRDEKDKGFLETRWEKENKVGTGVGILVETINVAENEDFANELYERLQKNSIEKEGFEKSTKPSTGYAVANSVSLIKDEPNIGKKGMLFIVKEKNIVACYFMVYETDRIDVGEMPFSMVKRACVNAFVEGMKSNTKTKTTINKNNDEEEDVPIYKTKRTVKKKKK